MLKKFTYLVVILYISVLYGQNLFEFGSDLRINFYFIGMAVTNSLFAFIIYKLIKNMATSYFLFMCIGEVFNQVFYSGEYNYIELAFGMVGILFLLMEKKIKECLT